MLNVFKLVIIFLSLITNVLASRLVSMDISSPLLFKPQKSLELKAQSLFA